MCGAQHFTSWDDYLSFPKPKKQGFPKVAQTTQQEKPGKILAPGAHLEHHDRLPGGHQLGKPFSLKDHGMEWGITWYHMFNIFRHPHENANAFHTVKVCPFSCIVGSNAKTLRNQEWLDELAPREWGIMSSRHVFLANPGKPRGFRFVSHSKGRIRKVHD